MSSFKTLHGVQLQPCCIRTIERIRSRVELSQALRYGAPASIFAQMFIGLPKSDIATLYSVSTTDWKLLAEVIISIGTITKRAILNDAALEMVNHPTGQLGDFWMGVYEAFGGH
jgi:hypothetical protein